MNFTRTRSFRVLAASALTAGAIGLAAPSIADAAPFEPTPAGGTKDQRYSAPPQATPDDSENQRPLNENRAPLQQCPGGSAGGTYSEDPAYYPIELGKRGPVSFDFSWDTYSIPDKFDILYEGKQVYTTGWRGAESRNSNGHRLSGPGAGQTSVQLPAGRSTQIEVRVITDDRNTEWKFRVACPA